MLKESFGDVVERHIIEWIVEDSRRRRKRIYTYLDVPVVVGVLS